MSVELINYEQLINLEQLTVPEGEVKEISYNGNPIWYSADNFIGYQPVEWICAEKNVGAYLDLGFSFDTAATIYIEQFLDNAPQWLASNEETYPFGAAESSGKYRCMLTSPGNSYGAFIYGGNGSTYLNSYGKYIYQGKNNLKIVMKAGDAHWENLDTGEVSTKPAGHIAYTMTSNLYLFAQNYNGTVRFNKSSGHSRKIGRFSYYDKDDNLICDLFPCYHKLNGTIGMFDAVRKIFLTNVGTGNFTKGNDCLPYINLADPATEEWLENSRFSTSSISSATGGIITNHIACKKGDIIRIKGMKMNVVLGGSNARIRLYNGTTVADAGNITNIGLIESGNGSNINGDITTLMLTEGNTTHVNNELNRTFNNVRLNGTLLDGYTIDDIIITVNEEITEHRLNTNIITFTIDGVEYQAENGMTWGEWVNSEYNTDFCIVGDNNGHLCDRDWIAILFSGDYAYSSDLIIPGMNGIIEEDEF